jgi:hypothetical protein
VDAAGIMGNPSRVLPALIASEKAMPDNFNASAHLPPPFRPATLGRQYRHRERYEHFGASVNTGSLKDVEVKPRRPFGPCGLRKSG